MHQHKNKHILPTPTTPPPRNNTLVLRTMLQPLHSLLQSNNNSRLSKCWKYACKASRANPRRSPSMINRTRTPSVPIIRRIKANRNNPRTSPSIWRGTPRGTPNDLQRPPFLKSCLKVKKNNGPKKTQVTSFLQPQQRISSLQQTTQPGRTSIRKEFRSPRRTTKTKIRSVASIAREDSILKVFSSLNLSLFAFEWSVPFASKAREMRTRSWWQRMNKKNQLAIGSTAFCLDCLFCVLTNYTPL